MRHNSRQPTQPPPSASNAPPMATTNSGAATATGRTPASATVDLVCELSDLLRTGLDRRQVQVIMALLDSGVNPHALAAAVQELRAMRPTPAGGSGGGGGGGGSGGGGGTGGGGGSA